MIKSDLGPTVYHFRTDFLATDPRYAVLNMADVMAKALLDRHDQVCPPTRVSKDDAVVRIYAKLMERGEWRLNGDTIIVATNGEVLDGVARLRAIAMSGCDVPAILVTGVDPAVRSTINTHVKRNTTDVLNINGEEFPSAIANAWTVIYGYVKAPDRSRFMARQYKVGLLQVEELTSRFPEVRKSAEISRPVAGLASQATMTALHFLFAKVDPAKADGFFRDLALAEPTEPVTGLLRRKLKALRTKGHSTPRTYLAAVVVKAWERYRDGRSISLSGLDFSGDTEISRGMEAFPTISDLPGIDVDDKPPQPPPLVGQDDETVRIFPVILDVATANHLLANNGPVGSEKNRSVRRQHVQRIARDIDEGRWGFNGQTIKVSRSGRLIDGQHRCHAVIQTGKPIRTYLVEGVEDSVFSTFDTGKRRQLSSILKTAGATSEHLYAGTLSALFALRNPYAQASHGELMEIYEAQPEVASAVAHVGKWSAQCTMLKLEGSACAALYHLFRQKDPVLAEEFLGRLMDGDGLVKGSPVYALRERLLRHARAKTGEPDRVFKMRLVISAWNLTRQGKPAPRNGLAAEGTAAPEIL